VWASSTGSPSKTSFPAACRSPKAGRSRSGRRRAAPARRTCPPGTIATARHATAGHYRSLPSAQVVLPPMTMPDGPFLDYAAAVKKETNVPVIAVGRLGDPALAESAVASGKTDFVALGRTLVADPQWVDKVAR